MLNYCDVYTDDGFVNSCELKPDQIKVGNEFYITGEPTTFVIDRIEEDTEENVVNLFCEPVYTSDVSAVIWHHRSFLHRHHRGRDGISPGQAQKIIRLLQEKGYLALEVYASDHGVITYGVLDREITYGVINTDTVMVDYFFSPVDVIEWLNS